MAAYPQPSLTPEQYLALDRASEFRNEYYDGVMYAMSGGSHPHATIIGNLTREFGLILKKQLCLVTPSEVHVRLIYIPIWLSPVSLVNTPTISQTRC